MRLVMLGPPGAGKGTQASRLSQRLGIPHVATGDMFRKASEANTPVARRVRDYVDKGELVSDELTNEMVRRRLSKEDARSGFILDGYPRNVEQAAALDRILDGLGEKLDRVVKLRVTRDEIVGRLSGRRLCPECQTVYHVKISPAKNDELCDNDGTPLVQREDDKEETILRRLEVFGEQTKLLYDFYKDHGLFVEVDAIGSTDEVFEVLLESLGV